MQLISTAYFAFILAIFAVYYFLPLRAQNRLVLTASLGFLLLWSPIALGTHLAVVIPVFLAALKLPSLGRRLQAVVVAGLFAYGFAIHLVFKLGIDSWYANRAAGGVLAIGLTFYTLQSLGYLIDVRRKVVPAEKDFWRYLRFTSFFPLQISGPIERYSVLTPQFEPRRIFQKSLVSEGLFLLFFGLFKKLVLVERLDVIIQARNDSAFTLAGGGLHLFLVLAWFQLFLDFSSAIDIARGTAKLLGINLSHNFRMPYFAQNPSDMWRRWHISLIAWLRDYIYLPLLLKTKSILLSSFVVIFAVGLWHDFSLKFLAWSMFWYGLFLVYHSLRRYNMWALRRPLLFQPLKAVLLLWISSLSGIFLLFHDFHTQKLAFQGLWQMPALDIPRLLDEWKISFLDFTVVTAGIAAVILSEWAYFRLLNRKDTVPRALVLFTLGLVFLFLALALGVNESTNFIYMGF